MLHERESVRLYFSYYKERVHVDGCRIRTMSEKKKRHINQNSIFFPVVDVSYRGGSSYNEEQDLSGEGAKWVNLCMH